MMAQGKKTVLFACVHNAGRSQIATAIFNALVDPAKAHAISAGTRPGERVHPEVIEVVRELELGIDLSNVVPRKLTADIAADLLVTMGCGEECPVLSSGPERDDWPFDDPKGQPIERVRAIRDAIDVRVRRLLADRGWLLLRR